MKTLAYTKVLCGDCLRVREFSESRHKGEELCECGGEFCGCEECTDTINALLDGKRKAAEIGCQTDVAVWSANKGIYENAV